MREVQVKNGDANRQIWLLEFGWTADKIHPDYAWFAVSEDKKAENIVKAFQYARKNWSPWIGVMTLWTLADPSWTPTARSTGGRSTIPTDAARGANAVRVGARLRAARSDSSAP